MCNLNLYETFFREASEKEKKEKQHKKILSAKRADFFFCFSSFGRSPGPSTEWIYDILVCHFSCPADAEFAFEIYDADGSKNIDANDLGDILRALNTNPTLALIEKMGGTKKRKEKLLSLEEFLPIYAQVKKEKEQGCFEDFVECLKLYDKNEDGHMLLAELNHALLALGEALQPEQVEALFKDCMGEENDEGEILYTRKCPFARTAHTLFVNSDEFLFSFRGKSVKCIHRSIFSCWPPLPPENDTIYVLCEMWLFV